MPNLSILDLLDFCKVNVENANGTVVEEIDINSCQTWLTVRTVRSGLKNAHSIDIHANYCDVTATWVDDETLLSKNEHWVIDPIWEDLNRRLVEQREVEMDFDPETVENRFLFTFQELIDAIQTKIDSLDSTEEANMEAFKAGLQGSNDHLFPSR